MGIFLRIFGWPHELLHALALLLIGRRPEGISKTHVDIPADLSTWQYVFVAGLPALVFWGAALVGLMAFMNAPNLLQSALQLVITGIFSLAALGTMGDIALIIERVSRENHNKG
jgi:putative zincin peptidase